MYHVPVMADVVTSFLLEKRGRLFIDATIGTGGHAESLLRAGGGRITVIGIDRDPTALEAARSRLAPYHADVKLVCGNFRDVRTLIETRGCDGFVLDLGLSSLQLDDASRGFSYRSDGPLGMAMGEDGRSVRELVNTAGADEIARILRDLGEVKRYRAVARAIVRARERGRIERTRDLREAVSGVIRGEEEPAALSRIFQAFRIWANDELENLTAVLPQAVELLARGGRLAVISYHSLEDRIVKRFFRREERGCVCPPDLPVCRCNHEPRLAVLTHRPVRPSSEEVAANPRARSARLRVAEKIA